MNENGQEVEFRARGDEFEMWVESDRHPFNDYVCGVIRQDDNGFYIFQPAAGVAMHWKLLQEAADEVSRLNG